MSKQQPLMFVIVDKVGCSNDKSLSLSPRPNEKHTFWQVTHYSKCDLPLVWRGPHFTARLRSPCWHCYGRLWWPFVTKDRLLLKLPSHEVWGPSLKLAYGQLRYMLEEMQAWPNHKPRLHSVFKAGELPAVEVVTRRRLCEKGQAARQGTRVWCFWWCVMCATHHRGSSPQLTRRGAPATENVCKLGRPRSGSSWPSEQRTRSGRGEPVSLPKLLCYTLLFLLPESKITTGAAICRHCLVQCNS